MKNRLNQIVPVHGDLDLFAIAHDRLFASQNALEIGRAPHAALAFDMAGHAQTLESLLQRFAFR